MRTLSLALVVLGTVVVAGCNTYDPNSNFFWNSLLVPAKPEAPIVSGTGATERPEVAVAPAAPAPEAPKAQ
jgi:hypothetical protein